MRGKDGIMKFLMIFSAVLLALGVGACEGDLLDVYPVDEIDGEAAITDGASAQAALFGAYEALFGYVAGDQNYYSGDYVAFGDLLSDNAEHQGTFDTYSQAGRNSLLAESITLDRIWSAIYDAINRVNILIREGPDPGRPGCCSGQPDLG